MRNGDDWRGYITRGGWIEREKKWRYGTVGGNGGTVRDAEGDL